LCLSDRTTDKEVVETLLKEPVDIIIDVNGHTTGGKPHLLALPLAPVRLSHLGFAGTTGAPGIQYVLLDRFIAPVDLAVWFSERIVFAPYTYQVNGVSATLPRPPVWIYEPRLGTLPAQRRPVIPSEAAVHASVPYGVAVARGVVIACFNSNHKSSPAAFDIWSNILHRVDGLLWLLHTSRSAHDALMQEGKARGLTRRNIAWSQRALPEVHIKRTARADLIVDTLTYNAHTVATDSLWAGVPVLTASGGTMAARVAGGLIGCASKELSASFVVDSVKEYEDRALSFL